MPAALRPLPGAILFDFDGTLADSYPAITAGVNHIRSQYGLPPLTVAEVKPFVGHGPENLLERTVPGCNPLADGQTYRAHHPEVMYELTTLFPGVASALGKLAALRVRLGICSNKPRRFTVALLEHFGLAPLFAVILGPEDVAAAKPAPDMLVMAGERLGLSRDQLLYVGDMRVDLQTARAAGVRVWVVPTGSDSRDDLIAAGPDRLIDRIADIPDLLTTPDRVGGVVLTESPH
jgi:2-phosphoglycolate phosphatase